MQTEFSVGKRLGHALLAAGLALGLLATNASAQVDYVRELIGTGDVGTPGSVVVPASQAPYETSNPGYANNPTPYLFALDQYYAINSTTGALAPPIQFPHNARPNIQPVFSLAGQNIANPLLFFITNQSRLATLNVASGLAVNVSVVSVEVEILSSIAARSRDGGLLSYIADAQHFTVNRINGEMIAMSLADVDMGAALYQSYGQDGLLYVLDYGNSRMAGFDPDNAFAPVSSFDLNTGITTANVQFGIGVNGSFYLADGLGGGSYYDAAGEFQGTFSVPEGTVGDSYTGASYVSTDSAGYVYVFDSATGFHQYHDAAIAAVPEPSIAASAMVGLLAIVILLRRQRAVR